MQSLSWYLLQYWKLLLQDERLWKSNLVLQQTILERGDQAARTEVQQSWELLCSSWSRKNESQLLYWSIQNIFSFCLNWLLQSTQQSWNFVCSIWSVRYSWKIFPSINLGKKNKITLELLSDVLFIHATWQLSKTWEQILRINLIL